MPNLPQPALTVQDQVAEIRFGDPARRNALGRAFWQTLPNLMAEIEASPEVRTLIIRSEGPHFCSGIDLDYLKSLLPEGGADPARDREKLRREIITLQDVINGVARCRVPVIAVVQGACMGGGLDLIAATDMVYASADAGFTIQETNIGLAADLGSLQRLPHRMNAGLLSELAYTGRTMSADEALSCGLVASVHQDQDAALAHARTVAATIAAKSPMAILGTKRALTMTGADEIARGLDDIATWNAGLLSFADIETALAAIARKEKPDFQDLTD
jgi:enoyl-CoA hydratase